MIAAPAVLVALGGWRRRGLALLAGAAATLAMPPLHLVPVLWLSLPLLLWLTAASRTRRQAFGVGWWFGLGHFSSGLYWLSYALLTEPEKFGWMIPFAVFGLGGVLAAFLGAVTLAVHVTRATGVARVLIFVAAWGLAEWLRSWVLTGLPWNLLGTVWAETPPLLQTAAFVGVLGLGMATALAAALPALLAEDRRTGIRASLVGLALLGLLWAGGSWRLAGPQADPVPGVRLRLVQANIAQPHKWRDELREANLREHVELSRGPGFERITHVVWPETAAPYFLDLDPAARALVATAAPPGGLVITGAPRATPPGVEPFRIWNSLVAVDAAAQVAAVYDKVHLVPFGEYVPFRLILPIEKITHGTVDFSPGTGLATLTLPGLPPASPLICYEAIFPGAVVAPGQRSAWLLNLTNDGWFGLSAGPYQHLAAARLRAVEEGLPLVRAAYTGISVVVDAQGRTVAALGLGRRGVLDAPLPAAAPATLFARLGNLMPLALMTFAGFAGLLLRRFA